MEDALALREYLRMLWARRAMIVVVTLAAITAAGVISYFVLPPTYESSAILIVSGPRFRMSLPTNETRIQSSLQTILTEETGRLREQNIAPMVHNEVVGARVAGRLSRSRAMTPEDLVDKVRISAIRGTNLVKISTRHTSPQAAADIVEAWATEIVEYTGWVGTQEIRQSLAAVEREVAAAGSKLITAERALQEFDAVSKLPILDQRIDELVRRMAVYEVRLAELEQGGGPLEGQVALQPQGGGYSMSVSVLRDRGQVRRVLDTLRARLASYQAAASVERQRQVALTRRAGVLRSTFSLLVSKREELRILQAVYKSVVEVAVPATTPRRPVAPHKALNMAVAAVLGLIGGTLLAMVVGSSRESAPTPTAPVGQESVPISRT